MVISNMVMNFQKVDIYWNLVTLLTCLLLTPATWQVSIMHTKIHVRTFIVENVKKYDFVNTSCTLYTGKRRRQTGFKCSIERYAMLLCDNIRQKKTLIYHTRLSRVVVGNMWLIVRRFVCIRRCTKRTCVHGTCKHLEYPSCGIVYIR